MYPLDLRHWRYEVKVAQWLDGFCSHTTFETQETIVGTTISVSRNVVAKFLEISGLLSPGIDRYRNGTKYC
jgi:hypothetical protein